MAGPLAGYRIIEIAGIGPGPFCAMMLADMGADVVRVDRAETCVGRLVHSAPVLRRAGTGAPLDRGRPQEPRRRRDGAQARRDRRRAHRGLPAGRHGAARHRARRVPRPQPEARVRPHDRMGAGRPVRGMRPATTSTTSRSPVRSRTSGDAGEAAGPAAEPRRRLRRRRHVPRVRRGVRAPRRAEVGQGPGRRRRDGRRRRGPDDDVPRLPSDRACATNERGSNLLDTGSHFYDAYECSDGEYVSIGSIEPQFYAELLRITGLSDDPEFAKQMDVTSWPGLKQRLREVFRTKTRDEWCALMEHTDVCFAPVLTIDEAAGHPHNVARKTFVEVGGISQPAPAPRFSRTQAELSAPSVARGAALRRRAVRLAEHERRRDHEAARVRRGPVGARLDGDARLLPRASRRRVDHDRRHDRARRRGGARAVLVVATAW